VEYCNGHTQANVMLQELMSIEVYGRFFEECRIRRGMQPIPLDGYLLTPVQRICKYPLQLNELYKYTKVVLTITHKLLQLLSFFVVAICID
jgi:hypothetical protein